MEIRELIGKCMTELANFYEEKLNPSKLNFFERKLKWVNVQDLRSATDNYMTKERRMPTPDDLLKYVDEARQKREFHEKRKEKSSFVQPERRDSNPNFVKELVRFTLRMLDMPPSKERCEKTLEWAQELNKKYPGSCQEIIRQTKHELAMMQSPVKIDYHPEINGEIDHEF